jgi:peptide/nickel transport system substrate-binding protein
LYDTLMQDDPVQGMTPNLAERWELSPDSSRLTVWLDPAARWHTGQPVTSEDVVFSVNLVRERSLPGWSGVAATVDRVEAIGAREVQLTLLAPELDVVHELCTQLPIVPAVFWEDLDDPKGYANLEIPVGSGPFELEEYAAGERLVLSNTRVHHSTRPEIATLVVEILRDETKALQALKDDQLDALGWDMMPSVVGDIRDHAEKYPGVQWSSVPGTQLRVVLLNLRLAPYDNIELRVALAAAVDAQAVVNKVLLGFGQPASADPFPPASPWHNPDISPVPFDPQRAMERLEAAGFRDTTGDGLRERPDGTALLIPITYAKGDSQQRVVESIVAYWKTVGVAAKAVPISPEKMLPTLMEAGFEAAVVDLSLDAPGDAHLYFHSSRGTLNGGRVVGWNYGAYASASFDRTAELMSEERDMDKRAGLLRQLQSRLSSDLPYIPLFSPYVLSLYREMRFSGWTLQPGAGLLHRLAVASLSVRE